MKNLLREPSPDGHVWALAPILLILIALIILSTTSCRKSETPDAVLTSSTVTTSSDVRSTEPMQPSAPVDDSATATLEGRTPARQQQGLATPITHRQSAGRPNPGILAAVPTTGNCTATAKFTKAIHPFNSVIAEYKGKKYYSEPVPNPKANSITATWKSIPCAAKQNTVTLSLAVEIPFTVR